MPKISKESAPNVEDFGPALDLSGQLDDYTVDFVTIRQEHSLAGMFRATRRQLPVPALGLPVRRRITVTYADQVEVYQAGDAF